jgi:cytochrome c-type biogenesis protein CcmH/NrfG
VRQRAANLRKAAGKDSATPWIVIWGVNMKRHAYADAIAAAETSVNLDSGSSMAWGSLGLAYLYEGQHKKEAVQALQESVRLSPLDARSWVGLGRAQSANRQLDESVESLQQAIKLSPDDAIALYQLGLTYSKQGKEGQVFDVIAKLTLLNRTDLGDKLFAKIPPLEEK